MRRAIGNEVLTGTATLRKYGRVGLYDRLGRVGRITAVAVGGWVAGAWDSPRYSTLSLK